TVSAFATREGLQWAVVLREHRGRTLGFCVQKAWRGAGGRAGGPRSIGGGGGGPGGGQGQGVGRRGPGGVASAGGGRGGAGGVGACSRPLKGRSGAWRSSPPSTLGPPPFRA